MLRITWSDSCCSFPMRGGGMAAGPASRSGSRPGRKQAAALTLTILYSYLVLVVTTVLVPCSDVGTISLKRLAYYSYIPYVYLMY